MKTNPLLREGLMIALLIAPFAYLAIIWPQLPDALPGHYGADGRPDRYDPKGELALMMALPTLFLYVVFLLLPRFDPRRNLNTTLYQKIRWVITLFWVAFLVWFWTISWRGVGADTFTDTLMTGVGLLLVGLGNLLNSVKPNYFVGVRTPWTLESEVVWRRTHHLAARLFVIGGLLMVALIWLVPQSAKMPVVITVSLVVALVPVVFSYVYFRQEKAGQLSN